MKTAERAFVNNLSQNRDLHLEGARRSAMEVARNRLMVPMVLFSLGFLILTVKLLAVGLFQDLSDVARMRGPNEKAFIMSRADIIDRNGVVLASNLKSASLAVRPRLIMDAEEVADGLLEILPELNRAQLLDKLKSSRSYAWIKRRLTPEQIWAINGLGYVGLELSDTERRVYPHGPLLSHVLGYVGIDNQPFAGVERFFEDRLSDPLRANEPLQLSIDIRLQHILHRELGNAMEKFSARGAGGLVMDIHTGEVLALASLPDFDPNDYGSAGDDQRFNRVLQGVYEMGSGFKTFTVAMALDHKIVNLSGGFDATEPLKVAGFTIRDDHAKKRWLSVPEIFTYSSNIGSALMAEKIGREKQQAFLEKLGLFEKASIEIGEVEKPLLPRQWGPVEMMTVSYGHGIAVSPLHLANGIAAMVNGGRLIPATLLVKDKPTEGVRVISKKTSRMMADLLHLAVEYGTGSKAKVAHYSVGGKTGTAEKPGVGGYRKKDLVSSFVGVFPMENPRYVVFAMLDEPRGTKDTFNFATGGWTAAPVVGKVISYIGPLLGVMPVGVQKVKYKNLILASMDKR